MDYLVALQEIRETCPGALLSLMVLMSEFCIYGLPLLICVMYWCVEKKFAQVAMVNLAAGNLFNNFLKLCFSVYRPWVRDPRAYVAKEAASTAEGYSFPSGHSTAAGAVFTSILKRYGKKTWIRVICIVFMIAVPFSRMFLGAHTIEDVLAGLFLGVVMIFLGEPIVNRVNRSRRNELIYLLVCVTVCVLMLAFVETKNYPMELKADGSLLVDPDTMKPSMYGACGMVLGWAIAWPLERHCIDFAMPASKKEAWIRAILGILAFVIVFFGIKKLGAGWDSRAEQIIRYGAAVIVAGYVYPLSFKKLGLLINGKDQKTEA